MDINDPRLEQARTNMTERLRSYDDRIISVLKGHLSLEQSLNGLLRAAR